MCLSSRQGADNIKFFETAAKRRGEGGGRRPKPGKFCHEPYQHVPGLKAKMLGGGMLLLHVEKLSQAT